AGMSWSDCASSSLMATVTLTSAAPDVARVTLMLSSARSSSWSLRTVTGCAMLKFAALKWSTGGKTSTLPGFCEKTLTVVSPSGGSDSRTLNVPDAPSLRDTVEGIAWTARLSGSSTVTDVVRGGGVGVMPLAVKVMVATSPRASSSSTALAVTACAVMKLSGVKVSDAGVTATFAALDEVTATVTLPLGLKVRATLNLPAFLTGSFSVNIKLGGVTSRFTASSSVISTGTLTA